MVVLDNRQIATDVSTPSDNAPVMELEELQRLLEENDGGEVSLTGNVVLQCWDSLCVTNPTTVKMGDFNITVLGYGAQIYVYGPIHFVGNGDKQPLFTIKNRGEIIFDGNATVTATNSGATAMLGDGDMYLEQPEIYAPKGVAVHAKGMAILFYGYVSGESSVLSDRGKVLLQSTITIPSPPKAKIVHQTAIPFSGHELDRYGICIEQGSDSFEYMLEDIVYFYFFERQNPNMLNSTTLIKSVDWRIGEDFNKDIIGEYSIYMSPDLSDKRMAVEGLNKAKLPLYVVDPTVPWLSRAIRNQYGDLTIGYFKPIENSEKITLWYSTDEGKTWLDAQESLGFEPDSEYNANIVIPDDLLEDNGTVYWFKLEVVGGDIEGISNIIKVWYSPYENSGGDRTGADRFADWDDTDEPNVDDNKENGSADKPDKTNENNNTDDDNTQNKVPEVNGTSSGDNDSKGVLSSIDKSKPSDPSINNTINDEIISDQKTDDNSHKDATDYGKKNMEDSSQAEPANTGYKGYAGGLFVPIIKSENEFVKIDLERLQDNQGEYGTTAAKQYGPEELYVDYTDALSQQHYRKVDYALIIVSSMSVLIIGGYVFLRIKYGDRK